MEGVSWRPKYKVPPPGAIVLADLPEDAKGRRIWTCSTCGKSGRWGKGWATYGSILEQEEFGWVRSVTCSDACRSELPKGEVQPDNRRE